MKVLLVDDEAPARQLLKEYLGAYPQLEFVAEATNGIEAARLIGELRPDLVFLDIQMPGLSGLDVVRHLENLPLIIFATAYDHYAVEAFELSAVDYLLKPFTRERLARAVDKVLAQPTEQLAKLQALTERLLSGAAPTAQLPKLLITVGKRMVVVDANDIVRLEADGDYARVVTASDTYLSSSSLADLLRRLDATLFYQVHRSSVVNIEHLAEVRREGISYYLQLSNADVVRVSRGYSSVVKDWQV